MNCMICNKSITDNMKAVLDSKHEAHLRCWCNLLPDMRYITDKEKEIILEKLIKKFLGR